MVKNVPDMSEPFQKSQMAEVPEMVGKGRKWSGMAANGRKC